MQQLTFNKRQCSLFRVSKNQIFKIGHWQQKSVGERLGKIGRKPLGLDLEAVSLKALCLSPPSARKAQIL